MSQLYPFTVNYLGQEQHLVLPTVTSIVLVQNLYDVLFQYVLTPEQEKNLESFIKRLEAHIKKKSRAPFSIPVQELEFLGDGLEELQLLNWMELPILKFSVVLKDDQARSQEQEEEIMVQIMESFQDYMIISRIENSRVFFSYPYRLTSY
ncbi:MAG: hypothetical protein ABRQ26_13520 [Syntrophomonadaceae bacterium]